MICPKISTLYLSILDIQPPDGAARIVKMDPEGFAEVPDRSVGFELECIAEGDPEPRVTWSRGIIILKDNCFCLIIFTKR